VKRSLSVFLILSLITFGLPINSHAITKAGSKCPTLGVKSVVGGKTFTCIKSGKKQVWDKGILNKKQSPKSEVIKLLPPKPLTPILYLDPVQDYGVWTQGFGKKFIIEIPEYPLKEDIALQGILQPDPREPLYLFEPCKLNPLQGEYFSFRRSKILTTPIKIYCWASDKPTAISFKTLAIQTKGVLGIKEYCGVDCLEVSNIIFSETATLKLK